MPVSSPPFRVERVIACQSITGDADEIMCVVRWPLLGPTVSSVWRGGVLNCFYLPPENGRRMGDVCHELRCA